MKLAILILAGGEGRRMLGRDKGLMPYRGQPLVSYPCAAVSSLQAPIFISANRCYFRYKRFARQVMSDQQRGFNGPLVALVDALHNIQKIHPACTHILTLPCDTPYISSKDIDRLLDASHRLPHAWQIAQAGSRVQPLHGVFPITQMPVISALVKQGERRMMRAVNAANVGYVTLENKAVKNINSLRQLRA